MPASAPSPRRPRPAVAALAVLALCLPILLGFTLPGEFGRLIEAGNKAYSRGDYRRAATRYGNALEVTPDSPEALFNRGAARYKSDDFDAALEDFAGATRGATGILKQHAEYNAGNCDYRMQRYDDAIERYKRALTLDPADTWAKHNLEMALRAKQQQEQQDNQKQNQDDQDQQKQDQQNQDQQKQDQQEQDQQEQDQQEQDQQKQDQQKQDQQKQDQQKQDQQKQEQQKQEQQKQEQQKQEQERQDQQKGQGASDAKQEQAQPMTPEQAAQLLGALAREDATLHKLMRRAPMTPEKPTDKDW